LKLNAGVWQVIRNIPLPYSEFTGMQPIALGGTNINAIGLLGLNAVASLPLQGQVWALTELDGYETPIKDAHLNDVVTGDLNSDGRKDLARILSADSYFGDEACARREIQR